MKRSSLSKHKCNKYKCRLISCFKPNILEKVFSLEAFNKTIFAFLCDALAPKAENNSGQIVFAIAYSSKQINTACKEVSFFRALAMFSSAWSLNRSQLYQWILKTLKKVAYLRNQKVRLSKDLSPAQSSLILSNVVSVISGHLQL